MVRLTMPVSKRELGWDNDHEEQQLWAKVSGWDYKVVFTSFKSRSTLFQFQGVVSRASGLTGLEVTGGIEIPVDLDYPAEDSPSYEHQSTLYLLDEGRGDPCVSVTLLVAPELFTELFRVFSAAFGGNGALDLHLWLKHDKGALPDFWRSRWQKENIQISEFGFHSGANFCEQRI